MHETRAVAGRFELLRLAGQGGMGRVYEARDLLRDERVAFKVSLQGTHPEHAARFVREAEALASLADPRVARHVAHGRTDEGELYLAMEWIEGETLRDRLVRSPLAMAESVTLAATLAGALGAVHAAGMIHRDVKPNNILLAGGALDRPVLVDFGLARLPGAGRLTLTGATLGTPGYMAPEQARGEADVDARADVFSLGCVLYRCLTGVEAFTGTDPLQLLLQLVLDDPPRVSALRRDVPAALDTLVTRLLSKGRDGRPPDGGAVAAELMRLGASSGAAPSLSAAPPSSKKITSSERRVTCLVLMRDPRGEMDSYPDREGATGAASPRARAARDVAARHRGRVEMLADDAVLVALTSAAAPTDLAVSAARCALSLRSVLGDLPIAVATGWTELEGKLPVGQVIEQALGLLRAAGAPGAGGPILLDGVTARLAGARFEIVETAHGNELRGERDEEDPIPHLLGRPTACVGRERELMMLESAAVQCIEDSSPAVVMITGRPGTGKSRLRKELSRRLRGRALPHETWIGHGDPLGAGAAFGLLGRAIQSALGIREGEPPAARRARIEAAVAALSGADRLGLFLGELLGVHAASDEHPQLRAARRDPLLMGDQIRRAAQDLLQARCEARLVVLVLEDLQWGDLPTMTFVDAALRSLSALPLLVLGIARPEVSEVFPRLWEDRPHQGLQLGGLSRRAAERFLQGALGAAPPEQIQALVKLADGNPFYLEELIRAVAAGHGSSFPDTVVAMAQARLEALSARARQVLRAASVFGRTFFPAGVEALLGGEPAGLQIADLVEREVLVRGDESRRARPAPGDEAPSAGDTELHFAHALVREAAYEMLTDKDRALGHLLAGQWLEQVGRGDPLAVAEHFERGGEPAGAVRWYRRAAEEALRGNDLVSAIAHAERAAAGGAAGEALGAVRDVQAEAHLWRGELAQAADRAREARDALPVGSEIWYRAVMSALLAASKMGDVDLVEECARAARSAAACDGARSAQVCCLAHAAVALAWAGRSSDLGARIAELADLAGDPSLIDAQARGVIHHLHCSRALTASALDRALLRMEDALRAFDEAGDRRNACTARMNTGYLRAELGDFAGAEAALREALVEAGRLGLYQLEADCLQNLGYALAGAGRLDEAWAVEEKAVRACHAQGQVRSEGLAQGYLARIALLRGDAAQAERSARAAASLLESAPPLRAGALAVLGRALLAQGRVDEALGSATEAFAQLEAEGSLEEGEALVRLVLVEALAAAGRTEEAERAFTAARERLLERAARIGDPALRERFLTGVPEHADTLAFSAASSVLTPGG